jgi:hypothetical protein
MAMSTWGMRLAVAGLAAALVLVGLVLVAPGGWRRVVVGPPVVAVTEALPGQLLPAAGPVAVAHRVFGRREGARLDSAPRLLVSIEPGDLVTVVRRRRSVAVLRLLPDGAWELVR